MVPHFSEQNIQKQTVMLSKVQVGRCRTCPYLPPFQCQVGSGPMHQPNPRSGTKGPHLHLLPTPSQPSPGQIGRGCCPTPGTTRGRTSQEGSLIPTLWKGPDKNDHRKHWSQWRYYLLQQGQGEDSLSFLRNKFHPT